ncbi:MAG: diguanylate cyclase [Cellvibrionaceae bacterium]
MTIDHALIIDGSKTTQAISSRLLTGVGIDYDMAANEADVWRLIKSRECPYDLVLVSRAALGRELRVFVSRLRALRDYCSVPLILLINDKGEDQDIESLYATGFTQVFSRKEFDRLGSYIEQAQSRNTFEKARQNKVVIIEDDLAQQLTVQAILEEKFCECFCFASAEAALEQVDVIQPHVIACDFFLEGKMTALDFVLKVKTAEHPWRHIPIAVMTGLDDPTRKYELVRSGANDYIPKPIDPLDLSVRIENLIRYKHLLDTVEQQKKDMQFLAMHDQLTGLYNRHFVAEHVQLGITEAQRHKTDYSMILLDIDHFKQVNDQNGHDVGDLVLKSVGGFLQEQSRGDDAVARLGGEEFLIILNYCDVNSAAEKAEKLRAGLEKLKPADLYVTASFGVAQLSEELDSFDKLFKAIDLAVYQSKNQGRNRVEIAPLGEGNEQSAVLEK